MHSNIQYCILHCFNKPLPQVQQVQRKLETLHIFSSVHMLKLFVLFKTTMYMLKLTYKGIFSKEFNFYNTYMFQSSTASCVFQNPLAFTFLLPASSLPCTSLRLSLSTLLSRICFFIVFRYVGMYKM